MAIQSAFYSGTALESRTFPSTKHIATKAHMAVWVQEKDIVPPATAKVWEQMNTSKFQLINNTAVLNQLLSIEIYDAIEVRVADTPDELTSSPADITIVSGISNEIVTVAGISTEVIAVANIDSEVFAVGTNITDVVTVAGNIIDINKVASMDSDVTEVAAIASDITAVNTDPLKASILAAEANATSSELKSWESEAARQTSDNYAVQASSVDVVTSNGDGTYTSTPTTDESSKTNANNSAASASEANASAIDANSSAQSINTESIANSSVIANGTLQSGVMSINATPSLIDINSSIDISYAKGIGLTNIQETTTAHTVDVSSHISTTVYIMKEYGVNAVVDTLPLLVGQSRPIGHTGSYLNTLDKKVYDSTDTAIELVALGEVTTDASGNAISIVEYEPLNSYFNDTISNDVVALGEFKGKNANDIVLNFDGVAVEISSNVGVSSLVRLATGRFQITLDSKLLNLKSSVLVSVSIQNSTTFAGITSGGYIVNETTVEIHTSNSVSSLANYDNVSVIISGGTN